MCICKFQLLFLSNWLSCAFENFYRNLRTINASLLFIIIIIIIIIIVKQKNKNYFNHFNRSEPFNLDGLIFISREFSIPCQIADVSLAKHPKGWNAMRCGYIHRLGGDFLLKEQRNIYFNFIFPTVDGGFSQWTTWSQCSATCGIGTQHRNRSCTDPSPANNGKPCNGTSYQTQRCNNSHTCLDPGKCFRKFSFLNGNLFPCLSVFSVDTEHSIF